MDTEDDPDRREDEPLIPRIASLPVALGKRDRKGDVNQRVHDVSSDVRAMTSRTRRPARRRRKRKRGRLKRWRDHRREQRRIKLSENAGKLCRGNRVPPMQGGYDCVNSCA